MKDKLVMAVLSAALVIGAVNATASDRAREAIDQCREHAATDYGVEKADTRFWQMSQAGRYVRVWLKLKSDEGREKALCKVHKLERKVMSLEPLN